MAFDSPTIPHDYMRTANGQPAHTEVRVVHGSGGPAAGVTVVLAYGSGRVSAPVMTDKSGCAVVPHGGSSTAMVMVNRRARGVVKVPGSCRFTL